MIVKMEIDPPLTSNMSRLRGVLVPEPPNTDDQCFIGLEAPCALDYALLSEANSGQHAYLFSGDLTEGKTFYFHFSQPQQTNRADIFQDFDNVYTQLRGDLLDFLQPEISQSAMEKISIDDTIDAIQQKFDYGERADDLETPTTFCGIKSGNCIDINTMLYACLRELGHTTSYLIGFHFAENAAGLEADGVHCWVATEDRRDCRYWDIAHCLRAGLEHPIASLNPLGGFRVAFSYGRGLRFVLDGQSLDPISHFGRPHWFFSDGRLIEADIRTHLVAPRRNVARAAFNTGDLAMTAAG